MRIMLDTNVLISAVVFGGRVRKILNILLDSECEVFVSEYVEREFTRKLYDKWPGDADSKYRVYKSLRILVCPSTTEILGIVRDEKDIPVLSDAVYNDADILLTGDHDLLVSTLAKPVVLSPPVILEYLWNHES